MFRFEREKRSRVNDMRIQRFKNLLHLNALVEFIPLLHAENIIVRFEFGGKGKRHELASAAWANACYQSHDCSDQNKSLVYCSLLVMTRLTTF